MGWATDYIAKLKNGETVSFRPRGSSMKGKIESGQLCTVSPVLGDLKVGDIVLCKVDGNPVPSFHQGNQRQQVSNRQQLRSYQRMEELKAIFGKLIKVEP